MADRTRSLEQGTVLMLMPALLLVLLLLGAIAVDSSIAFMAQRDLVAAAGDGSNDAGSLALDTAALLGRGVVSMRPADVVDAVVDGLRRSGLEDAVVDEVSLASDGRSAEVRVRRAVRLLFTALIPGAPSTTTVSATVRVTTIEG